MQPPWKPRGLKKINLSMAEAPTQEFLEVEDIRDGLLLLKDRSVRGVMLVSSLNFALKSAEEQDAILYQFQSFLNSLDFSVQIVIQSRRLNITGYIELLSQLEENQKVPLLKEQTAEYREFIEQLIKGGSIMTKQFFIAVPFYLTEVERERSPEEKKLSRAPKILGSLSDHELQRMKSQLWQRLEFVALGLRRCGLRTVPLNTEELIELFWSLHHPEQAEVGYYPRVPPEALEHKTEESSAE